MFELSEIVTLRNGSLPKPHVPDTQGDTGWYALYFRGKNNSLALMRGLAQALIARAQLTRAASARLPHSRTMGVVRR